MFNPMKYSYPILNHLLIIAIVPMVLISCKFNSEEKHLANLIQNDPGYEIQTELEESIKQGFEIYNDFCINCHRHNGEGIPKSFPPLASSDYLQNNRTQSIRAVKYGQQGEIVVNGEIYNSVMASQGLDDDEIANVMNYIMNSWGNTQEKMVKIEEVASLNK